MGHKISGRQKALNDKSGSAEGSVTDYFNVVLSLDGKHLFSRCNPSIYFEKLQPVLDSDTNSITYEVLTPLRIYIMVLWDNTVYSSYGLCYCFISFCTSVCVYVQVAGLIPDAVIGIFQ
jgi:hypothetical protein